MLKFQESNVRRRVWLKKNTGVNLIVITTPNRAPLNNRNQTQICTIILLPVYNLCDHHRHVNHAEIQAVLSGKTFIILVYWHDSVSRNFIFSSNQQYGTL